MLDRPWVSILAGGMSFSRAPRPREVFGRSLLGLAKASPNASGAQGSAGVRALAGDGLRLATVISSREVITSFIAFVTGDGVKLVPCRGTGECEVGVW